MYIIEARNVNGAYAEGIRLIRKEGVPQPSRAGDVLALPSPLMTVLHRPLERVLFDPDRDANPFFHLFESLFLLAGRDDYVWLDRFVRDFSARFAEPDGHGHGSYGKRWRSHFGYDQLDVVVEKLRADPNDRRVVIQMWDATEHNQDTEANIEWGADDLRADKRDIPCNTHVYPRIVDGRLDLTVCCRSNDLIWGLFGANAVQFSMLLEYLAGRIGVLPGRLMTLSNNAHAYVNRLSRYGDPLYREYWPDIYDDPRPMETVPIGTDWEHWDEDLRRFMNWADDPEGGAKVPKKPYLTGNQEFSNSWFREVLIPMWMSHANFRGEIIDDSISWAKGIRAPDWRIACQNWIKRRMK